MKKSQMFIYQVAPNETVTIRITPSIDLGNQYDAVLDDTDLDRPANGVYSFPVTKLVGKIHFFNIEFGFLGAPEGAQYGIEVNGNAPNNEGPFTLSLVNGDPLLGMQFKFNVVK
jgi:hypothetical protein